MRKLLLGVIVLLTGGLFTDSVLAQSFSANLGMNTEYIYRGIPQKTSSVFGGVDYENGAFSAGTWAADVGDGAEIDYYASYGFSAGDVGFSVGGTWYTYTGDFDDEYLELNLGVEWKFLSLDIAQGKYDNFAGPELDYGFYALTASHNGFFARVGGFSQDFDGDYYEAGYESSLTVDDHHWLDYTVTLIHSDATLLGGSSDTHFVLTLAKSFDL
jgi:hypothetical protein